MKWKNKYTQENNSTHRTICSFIIYFLFAHLRKHEQTTYLPVLLLNFYISFVLNYSQSQHNSVTCQHGPPTMLTIQLIKPQQYNANNRLENNACQAFIKLSWFHTVLLLNRTLHSSKMLNLA